MHSFCLLASMELILSPSCSSLQLHCNGMNSLTLLKRVKARNPDCNNQPQMKETIDRFINATHDGMNCIPVSLIGSLMPPMMVSTAHMSH